jgi:hypothetical protein
MRRELILGKASSWHTLFILVCCLYNDSPSDFWDLAPLQRRWNNVREDFLKCYGRRPRPLSNVLHYYGKPLLRRSDVCWLQERVKEC